MRLALALSTLLAAGVAHAAGDSAAPAGADRGRWYVRIDNDVVFETDRWYTSGVRIARVKDGWEIGLEQDVYTPEAKRLDPVDRPPTARLLASLARHYEGEGSLLTLEADAGVRGPSALGRQATAAIHHVVPAPHVDWSRQLPDRFDGSVAFARTQQLGSWPLRSHFGATVGTQVAFAHAGIEARIGDARAPSSPMLRFAATPPFAASASGWSAYVGASARAVGRNELLGPDYYVGAPAVSRRDEITRIAGGVAWAAPWGAFTFDLVQDSREFEGQRVPQRFGSLAIHVAF
ncbi:MAG TPA: lipid A deacylase LpxR family protein [Usitatibacter sp.]|nr:lipid A deacylase LpxR family protein [Usitatibacter sp.]